MEYLFTDPLPLEVMQLIVSSRELVMTIRCTCKKYRWFWCDAFRADNKVTAIFDENNNLTGVNVEQGGADLINIEWGIDRRLQIYATWLLARENSISGWFITWYETVQEHGTLMRAPTKFGKYPTIAAVYGSCSALLCCAPPDFNTGAGVYRYIGPSDDIISVSYYCDTNDMMIFCRDLLDDMNAAE